MNDAWFSVLIGRRCVFGFPGPIQILGIHFFFSSVFNLVLSQTSGGGELVVKAALAGFSIECDFNGCHCLENFGWLECFRLGSLGVIEAGGVCLLDMLPQTSVGLKRLLAELASAVSCIARTCFSMSQ